MIYWIFLFIAAMFETLWVYSLKMISIEKIKSIYPKVLYDAGLLIVLLPIVGYVFCGLANFYFLSIAMKKIPTATAYAVWTSLTLIMVKLWDTLYFHEKLFGSDIFFMLLITIGIVGLNAYGHK